MKCDHGAKGVYNMHCMTCAAMCILAHPKQLRLGLIHEWSDKFGHDEAKLKKVIVEMHTEAKGKCQKSIQA